MNSRIWTRAVVFTACAAALGALAQIPAGAKEGPGDARNGRVTYLEGQAQHRGGEAAKWDPLANKENVSSGETVQTKRKARAEIELEAAKVVRLDENTIVDLVKLFEEEKHKETVSMNVDQGQVWAQVASLGEDQAFQINSPLAAASVRGTVFNFAVAQNQATRVDVFRGSVEVWNPFPAAPPTASGGGFAAPHEVRGPHEVAGPREVSVEEWYYIVRAMQRIQINPGQSQFEVQDIRADEKQGSWRRWNEQRDRERMKRLGLPEGPSPAAQEAPAIPPAPPAEPAAPAPAETPPAATPAEPSAQQ